MDIHSFSESLQRSLREKLADLNLQEEDMVKIGHTLTLAIANEVVKKYVVNAFTNTPANNYKSALTWTGSKTDLIELIYALHYSKVIDAGNADIKTLATLFEQCFNVNLGNYYRVFQDIRLRKSSPTAFLEELRQNLQQHINSMND